MPPKGKQPVANKKADQKKKEKIIEDKTFGLKNKKGAKQQKFIQQVQHQVKYGGNVPQRKLDEAKKSEASKKEEKKRELAELNQLFKPVATQKVEKGADPKSVLCAFFKQGQCSKGEKCKFSHDLSVERKSEKRSIYVDIRDDDAIENWDDLKLKEIVTKKHGEADSKLKTEKICKFFLDALEKSKYGWFWECPNGDKCIYRHALPPGFVLNKDKKKDEKVEEISIEDLVERERAALGASLTKITLETFLAWKKRKLLEKETVKKKDDARKKAEFRAGKSIGLSGREMFTFNPAMATEDQTEEEGEVAYDTQHIIRENFVNDSEAVHEVNLENFIGEAQECDGTGTIRSLDVKRKEQEVTDNEVSEGAVGGGVTNAINGDHMDVPIDENLFFEDHDEELNSMAQELEDLDFN